jgi:cytochrome c oxidase subunit 4
MSHDEHGSHVNYLYVFFALCALTALSVLSDVYQPPSYALLIVIVLAIASAKAMCVLLFFMHLKFEGNWKYVLLAPTTILAIGLPLALLPDIGLHYYVNVAPQVVSQSDVDETEDDEEAAATEPAAH